jgi:hypothetical protein
VARLQREERLGALSLELANKKMLRLSELRGFTRAVRARDEAFRAPCKPLMHSTEGLHCAGVSVAADTSLKAAPR